MCKATGKVEGVSGDVLVGMGDRRGLRFCLQCRSTSNFVTLGKVLPLSGLLFPLLHCGKNSIVPYEGT